MPAPPSSVPTPAPTGPGTPQVSSTPASSSTPAYSRGGSPSPPPSSPEVPRISIAGVQEDGVIDKARAEDQPLAIRHNARVNPSE